MAFCDTVSRAMNSLIDAGSLLQNNALPAVLFPVRAVIASTVIYAPDHAGRRWRMGRCTASAAALSAWCRCWPCNCCCRCVLGYLLAVFAAAMRDTLQVVAFLLSVGIFLSPVLFPATMFPQALALGALAEPDVGAGHRLPGHPAAGAVAAGGHLGRARSRWIGGCCTWCWLSW